MALDKDHDGLKREFSANLQAFGQGGFKIVSGGSTVLGDFIAFTTIEDSTVSAVFPAGMNTDDLSSVLIPAGITIYGKFNSITSTGTLIAYNLIEG